MEVLSKLFGSTVRVRLMRLFMFNPERTFDITTLAQRTAATAAAIRRELKQLDEAGLVHIKTVKVFPKNPKKGRRKIVPKVTYQYGLDPEFTYMSELSKLLINTKLVQHSDVTKLIQKVGRIKLLILAGVFLQQEESRLDVLIVGDNIKQKPLENAIRKLEAEVGKELVYTSFETNDFQYRLSMYDKLIRDVLDFPHEKLVQKIPVR